MSEPHLVDIAGELVKEPIRKGFGRGLLEAGKRWDNVVAACADLTDSTQMNLFAKDFPERFIEIGVAEQNLVTVAAGMALAGKIPFVSSYAAFSPGRNMFSSRQICASAARYSWWYEIRRASCTTPFPSGASL